MSRWRVGQEWHSWEMVAPLQKPRILRPPLYLSPAQLARSHQGARSGVKSGHLATHLATHLGRGSPPGTGMVGSQLLPLLLLALVLPLRSDGHFSASSDTTIGKNR